MPKSCDPQKYNHENAEFVTSAKYTPLKNLYEYDILLINHDDLTARLFLYGM